MWRTPVAQKSVDKIIKISAKKTSLEMKKVPKTRGIPVF